MSSQDINNLFSRFGSRSGRYHEIVRDEQSQDAVGRWPLLSAIEVSQVQGIPGVQGQADASTPDAPTQATALSRLAPAAARPAPAIQPVGSPAPGVSRSELRMVSLAPSSARSAVFCRVEDTDTGSCVDGLPVNGQPAAELPAAQRRVTEPAPQGQAAAARPAHAAPERPGNTLRSLFGRLSAPAVPEAVAPQRPQPAFRRLRGS